MISQGNFRAPGPSVFVSYSFRDKQVAAAIEANLSQHGFRVQIEDETSLIGRDLETALRGRISASEAFVQILTRDASRSSWVQRELRFALTGPETARRVIVVVLVDGMDKPDHIPDQVCVPAVSGITPQVLADLRGRADEAVHRLPLSDNDPFRFDAVALRRAMVRWPQDRRRIMVDADGCLLRSVDEAIHHIQQTDIRRKVNHPV